MKLLSKKLLATILFSLFSITLASTTPAYAAAPIGGGLEGTDSSAPVFNGYQGVYVVNLDDPKTVADVKALLTASDNVDGNLTSSIVVTSDPLTGNEQVPGAYPIGFSVTDSSGNTATTTITVQVVDVTKPTITLDGPSIYHVEAGTQEATDWDRDLPTVTISDNYYTNLTPTTYTNYDPQTPGTYYVTYDVTDGSGNVANTVTVTVYLEDKTAPVITLNGSSSQVIEFGNNYVEQGATCADTFDTCNLTTSGTVNVGVLGTYYITYTATDPSGNTSTKTRTVVVQDTVDPEIEISLQNTFYVGGAPSYADFIANLVVTDNYDGDLTSSAVITLNEYEGNENTPGTYRINIEVSDSSGNTTYEIVEIGVIDNTAPVFTVSDLFMTQEEFDLMTLEDLYAYFGVYQ
jgi:hypothetical protein